MAILMLSACGSLGETPTAGPTTYVTITAPPAPTPRPIVTAAPNVQPGVLPDVVGVNHQLAKATMKAAGFNNLSEEDAIGLSRKLDPDGAWVVVEQQPPAGTAPKTLDVTIILRSKLFGE